MESVEESGGGEFSGGVAREGDGGVGGGRSSRRQRAESPVKEMVPPRDAPEMLRDSLAPSAKLD